LEVSAHKSAGSSGNCWKFWPSCTCCLARSLCWKFQQTLEVLARKTCWKFQQPPEVPAPFCEQAQWT
jgi:hypothetical protein